MKRKINYLQISQPRSRILQDDCWEYIFKFLKDDFDSLSRVSKQFFSITNRLRFSLTLELPALPFISSYFQRFTNLTSLNFPRFCNDLHTLITLISRFPWKITSLNFSKQLCFPADGLRALSQNIATLTSLTCSSIDFDCYYDLFLIADCFPLLKILDLSNTDLRKKGCSNLINSSRVKLHFEFLKLEVLNLSHTRIDDQQLYITSKTCPRLLQLSLNFCQQVTEKGVKHVLENCTQLGEIDIRWCYKVHPNIVPSMVLSRPSLRKIRAPPGHILSHMEKKPFQLQNCLVF